MRRWGLLLGSLLAWSVLIAACDSDDDPADGASAGAGGASTSSSHHGGSGGAFECNDAGVDAKDTPPMVSIQKPVEGDVYTQGQIIPLEGTAIDAVDGVLTSEKQVLWFKDMVDPTGEGPVNSYDPAEDGPLPPGPHPITLTAINSRCLEASTTVNIVVE